MTANDLYKDVPKEQAEHLLKFRADHPCKYVDIAGVRWEYIACGSGPDTLLLLPGGLFIAEHVFGYIELFEDACRVIAPTYPPLEDIDEVTNGLAAILDVERVQSAFVLGLSYSGMVAQVFVQRFPTRVRKLILSGAGPLLASRPLGIALSLISSLTAALPESIAKGLYQGMLNLMVAFPKSETAFWRAYLREVFSQRLTKAHIVSSFRQAEGAFKKYAFDRPGAKPWRGEVLILDGEKDALSTEGVRTAMAKFYPRSQVQVIPGIGHALGKLELIRYTEAVKRFLSVTNQKREAFLNSDR